MSSISALGTASSRVVYSLGPEEENPVDLYSLPITGTADVDASAKLN